MNWGKTVIGWLHYDLFWVMCSLTVLGASFSSTFFNTLMCVRMKLCVCASLKSLSTDFRNLSYWNKWFKIWIVSELLLYVIVLLLQPISGEWSLALSEHTDACDQLEFVYYKLFSIDLWNTAWKNGSANKYEN